MDMICCLVAQLCPTPGNPLDRGAWQAAVHGDSLGKNTGVSCQDMTREDPLNKLVWDALRVGA